MASQEDVKGEGFEIIGGKEGTKAEDEQPGEPAAQLTGLRPEIHKTLSSIPVYEAKGCKACAGTGFSGRDAVFEVLAMDQELRQAVASKIPVAKLPLDFGKPRHELPDQVLEKIKKGVCAWTEILAFR